MTDQTTVYEDTYNTYVHAERYADQIAGDNPGTHAVVVEVFHRGETDLEAAREKGRLRVVWSPSRDQIDAFLELHYSGNVDWSPVEEYVIQYETGPQEEL